MVIAGQLAANKLVWTAGMNKWEQARMLEDLKELFK